VLALNELDRILTDHAAPLQHALPCLEGGVFFMPGFSANTAPQAGFSFSQATYNIITNLAIAGQLAQLSGRATKVLLVLLARYNWKKRQAWPSIADISKLAGISHDTAQRALDDLEHAGLISPVRVSGKVNRYIFAAQLLDLSARNPWRHQTQPCVDHQVEPDAALRHEQVEDPEQEENQQQEHQAESVVVDSVTFSIPEEGRAHPPGDKLPRELYMQLKAMGVRAPWQLAHYGEQQLRDAIAAVNAKPNIKNRAGWIVAALKDGWVKPKPASVNVGARLEATQATIQERKALKAQLADPEQSKRSRLAMVAGFIAIKKPDADRLAALLARHQLTQHDLDAYLALQEAQEGPSK
jgi:DNA-binding transcriptional regulator YhcF (GntR family)